MNYNSFLPTLYRGFYSELAAVKGEITTETDDESPGAAVQARLLEALERQELLAGRRGGEPGARMYKEAQYIMAALADEILLNMEWAGRSEWKSHLLEQKIFGSHVAGEELFKRVDALLEERDPVLKELAFIYFMAISQGFRGKYRGRGKAESLDQYRTRLYAFIFSKKPIPLKNLDCLFPDSYAYTLSEGKGYSLPYFKYWIILIVVLIVGLSASSHFLWGQVTLDLEKVLQKLTRTEYS